jgi:hypothetical protein
MNTIGEKTTHLPAGNGAGVSVLPPKKIPPPVAGGVVSAHTSGTPSAGGSISQFLSGFEKQWQQAQQQSLRRIRTLSPQSRPYVELQLMVNRLNLNSQLISQSAEAVNSTLRRIQQLAGN